LREGSQATGAAGIPDGGKTMSNPDVELRPFHYLVVAFGADAAVRQQV
jgi:hypothetical protein